MTKLALFSTSLIIFICPQHGGVKPAPVWCSLWSVLRTMSNCIWMLWLCSIFPSLCTLGTLISYNSYVALVELNCMYSLIYVRIYLVGLRTLKSSNRSCFAISFHYLAVCCIKYSFLWSTHVQSCVNQVRWISEHISNITDALFFKMNSSKSYSTDPWSHQPEF